MKKYLSFLIAGILLGISTPGFALGGPGGDNVGNGGDVVAIAFENIARSTIQALQALQLSAALESDLQVLATNANIVVVNSADGLQLSGVPVDAINYPATKQIMVDRTRWSQNPNTQSEDTKRLVLHEYLEASGISDSTYLVSGSLVSALLAADLQQYTSLQQGLVAFDQLLKNLVQSFQTTMQSSDANTARNAVCNRISDYDNASDVVYEALTLAAPALTNDGFDNLKQTQTDIANYRMQFGIICTPTVNADPNQMPPLLSQIETEIENLLNNFSLQAVSSAP